MMRKSIVRSLATSKIHAYKLTVKDGAPEVVNLPIIPVTGKVTEKDALKAVTKEYGKDSAVTIGKIETEEEMYEISVEDFIKYAHKIEKTDEPATTEE